MTPRSGHPQGRWNEVRRLGDPNVGQAWLYVVTDATGQYPGEYAYKVLKNVSRPERVRRFRREIEITNALANDAISVVRVVDHGADADGRPFMVTPFFPRGNLRDYMASADFVDNLPATLAFVEQLAIVLKQVHESGVAHRDLKPENILIDNDGMPVLCDFGLCLPLWDTGDEQRNSETLEQIGSRHYMAPEALAGFPNVRNSTAVDVYAVGKIAYELAAGRALPGIELPAGTYDLSAPHPGAHDWYVLNSLVRDLVAHDPTQRMDAWQRLARTVDLAKRASNIVTEDPHPDEFELRITHALDANEGAREARRFRAISAERETYRNKLGEAISFGFVADRRFQQLEAFAGKDDRIEIRRGQGPDAGWFSQLPGYPELQPGEYRIDVRPWPQLSARLRVGEMPAGDVIPTLATDVVWRADERELRVIFSLYVVRFPGLQSLHAADPLQSIGFSDPPPRVVPLGWAQIGSEAYLAEVRVNAMELTARFSDLFMTVLGVQ